MIKKHLVILTATLLLASCGALSQSFYDSTRYVYDEVTQRESVRLGSYLCERNFYGGCYARSYMLDKNATSVSIRVRYSAEDWLFLRIAMAEGKRLSMTDPIRNVNSGGTSVRIEERFSVRVPLDTFAEWSCRHSRVVLRLSGDRYIDLPLAIAPISQFLAKAEDLFQLGIEDRACLSRESNV
ncbi:MAG: hypothetical protein OXG05_10570 [Gammaproteobacteria bacterium]|nr:hypothetical protein [Gammaproteobacteria bacterium]